MLNDVYAKRRKICATLYDLCSVNSQLFKLNNFMQIWPLLEELNDLEKDIPYCCSSDRSLDDFKSLFDFLDKQSLDTNISIENLECKSEYGIESKQEFQKNELIFEISNNQILTLNNLSCSVPEMTLNSLIKSNKILSMMENVSLALFLLSLRIHLNQSTVPTSVDHKLAVQWKDYLDVLPSFFHTPLYFSLEEILLLKTSQCFNDVINHIKNIVRQYSYISSLLDTNDGLDLLKSNFSYKNYCWSVSCTSTRQNQILDSTGRPQLALIPLIEICNHAEVNASTCIDYDLSDQSAKCYALKDIKKDEKLTLFYGRRTNCEMLIHNGFVCKFNQFDSFDMRLGMNSRDAFHSQRRVLLAQYGLECNEIFKVNSSFLSFDYELFRCFIFVKTFLSKTDSDLEKLSTNNEEEENALYAYLKNDCGVKNFLKTRLDIMLRTIRPVTERQDADTSANKIFISRLIDSEVNLIKKFRGILN